MSYDRLGILQHSLGLDQYGQGREYRSHFVTSPGTTDYPCCAAMVEEGLMTRHAGTELSGGGDVFIVTDAGRAYVREHSPTPPKLTRSQRNYLAFLDEDSGMRFGDWLKAQSAKVAT